MTCCLEPVGCALGLFHSLIDAMVFGLLLAGCHGWVIVGFGPVSCGYSHTPVINPALIWLQYRLFGAMVLPVALLVR